jgi:hypothetical protein
MLKMKTIIIKQSKLGEQEAGGDIARKRKRERQIQRQKDKRRESKKEKETKKMVAGWVSFRRAKSYENVLSS